MSKAQGQAATIMVHMSHVHQCLHCAGYDPCGVSRLHKTVLHITFTPTGCVHTNCMRVNGTTVRARETSSAARVGL